jgi:hypothetical protein
MVAMLVSHVKEANICAAPCASPLQIPGKLGTETNNQCVTEHRNWRVRLNDDRADRSPDLSQQYLFDKIAFEYIVEILRSQSRFNGRCTFISKAKNSIFHMRSPIFEL